MTELNYDLRSEVGSIAELVFTVHGVPLERGETLIREVLQVLENKRHEIRRPALWFLMALHRAVASEEG